MSWGLFPCDRRARRRLYKLAQKGVIRRAGQLVFEAGRPTQLYGPPCRPGMERHQVTITRVFDAYRPERFRVGSDCPYREDLTMIGEDTYHVEVWTGSQGRGQTLTRLAKFAGCDGNILFLMPDRKRLEKVRGWAKSLPQDIQDILFLAVTNDVLKRPFQDVYEDMNGVRCWVGLKPPGGRVATAQPGTLTEAT